MQSRVLAFPIIAAAAIVSSHVQADEPKAWFESRAALQLAGASAGNIGDVDFDYATSDVVTEKLGPDHIAHKHIGGVKYPGISFVMGADASPVLVKWVSDAMAQNHQRKDGAVLGGGVEVASPHADRRGRLPRCRNLEHGEGQCDQGRARVHRRSHHGRRVGERDAPPARRVQADARWARHDQGGPRRFALRGAVRRRSLEI